MAAADMAAASCLVEYALPDARPGVRKRARLSVGPGTMVCRCGPPAIPCWYKVVHDGRQKGLDTLAGFCYTAGEHAIDGLGREAATRRSENILITSSPHSYRVSVESHLSPDWLSLPHVIEVAIGYDADGRPVTTLVLEAAYQNDLITALNELHGVGLPLLSVCIAPEAVPPTAEESAA